MADDAATMWREVFEKWPAGIPKRGVILSTLNEATPFKSFLLKGNLLMLERTNPDPIGTRFILTDFGAIHLVKFVDQLSEAALTSAGYAGQFSKM